MKKLFKISISFLILLTFSQCGFFKAGENSVGDQSLTAAPVDMVFQAEQGQTYIKTLSFKNRSTETMLINNLAFVGDLPCRSEFSLYNILDQSGNVLYKSGQDISVTVAANQTVDINIRFAPQECESATIQLMIYYMQNDQSFSTNAALKAEVELGASGFDCDASDEDVVYLDGINDPTTPRSLNENMTYYFRIDAVRSYAAMPGAFVNYSFPVGTDYNTASIPEEDLYQPTYIPLISDGNGNLTLPDVTPCENVLLPTPITDTNLRGAKAILTIDEISGTVTSDGKLQFNNVTAGLYAAINNDQSLIQADTGEFRVSIFFDSIGTPKTGAYDVLEQVSEIEADDGGPLLNIISDGEGYKMEGDTIWHSRVTLVGVGYFVNNDDTFVGSTIAEQALLGDETAYIFVQLQGRFVYKQ